MHFLETSKPIQVLPSSIFVNMSTSHFGKDLSALGTIIDIYEVEDKKQCVFWLKNIEALNSRSINERMMQERKRKK